MWEKHTVLVHFNITVYYMIRVGVISSPPLTITTDDMYSEGYTRRDGLLIKVWEEIARRENIKYEYVPADEWMQNDMASEDDFYKHMASDDSKIDVYLGDSSINKRYTKYVDFSYPFLFLKSNILHYKEPLPVKLAAFFMKCLSFFAIFLVLSVSLNSFIIKYDYQKLMNKSLMTTLFMFTITSIFGFLMNKTGFSEPKHQAVLILKYIYMLVGVMFLLFVISGVIGIVREHMKVKVKPEKQVLSFDYNLQVDQMQQLNYPYRVLTEKKAFYTRGVGSDDQVLGMDAKAAQAEDEYTAGPEEVRGKLAEFYLSNRDKYSGLAPIPNMYQKYQKKLSNDPNLSALQPADYYFPLSNVAIAYKKDLNAGVKRKINNGILAMAKDGSLAGLVKSTEMSKGMIEKSELLQIN